VYAEPGHDHDKYRRQVRELGITRHRDASPNTLRPLGVIPLGGGGRFALLASGSAPAHPLEIRDYIHEGFLTLGFAITS